MRKAIVLGMFLVFMFAQVSYAHPPTDIKIQYDKKTLTLTAVIIHPVADPTKHYIKKVDVAVNGKEVISRAFRKQENKTSQQVSFTLPKVRPGDSIEVEGYCSIQGKAARSIKVK